MNVFSSQQRVIRIICNNEPSIKLDDLSQYLDSKIQILLLDPFDRSKLDRPMVKEDLIEYLQERSLKNKDINDQDDEENKINVEKLSRESIFNIICLMRQ